MAGRQEGVPNWQHAQVTCTTHSAPIPRFRELREYGSSDSGTDGKSGAAVANSRNRVRQDLAYFTPAMPVGNVSVLRQRARSGAQTVSNSFLSCLAIMGSVSKWSSLHSSASLTAAAAVGPPHMSMSAHVCALSASIPSAPPSSTRAFGGLVFASGKYRPRAARPSRRDQCPFPVGSLTCERARLTP